MCGVGGVINYSKSSLIDRGALTKLNAAMARRGPDAEGLWVSSDGYAGLAHRRLSVIDLDTRSDQPMVSADERLVLSFNGEIYNYRELKRELLAFGCSFRTNSDTEVLLEGYRVWGVDILNKLQGMFAFAIWDQRSGELFLARDPYGIKPLYYADDGRSMIFASQVKAIKSVRHCSLDPAGVAGFMMMGSVPEPHSIYREIKSLNAGHYIVVNEKGVSTLQEYCVPEKLWQTAEPVRAGSEHDVAAYLKESVRNHLVSDVPVGLFLSGGIDSGALLAFAAELGTQEINSFTLDFADFENTSMSEVERARHLVRQYGGNHTVARVSSDQVNRELPNLFDAMDQPSVDGLNTWLISKVAAEHGLKVVLSGVGGDELFGGYSHFSSLPKWQKWLDGISLVPGLPSLSEKALKLLADARFVPRKAAALVAFRQSLAGLYMVRRGLFLPSELPRVIGGIFGPDFVEEGLLQLRPPDFVGGGGGDSNSFRELAALESKNYLRNQLLRDSDWASMAHSLELRTPWVDAQLLESAGGLISMYRNVEEPKSMLANGPGHPLPKAVSLARKTGFGLPMAGWLESFDELSSWKRVPLLNDPACHWSRRYAYTQIERWLS